MRTKNEVREGGLEAVSVHRSFYERRMDETNNVQGSEQRPGYREMRGRRKLEKTLVDLLGILMDYGDQAGRDNMGMEKLAGEIFEIASLWLGQLVREENVSSIKGCLGQAEPAGMYLFKEGQSNLDLPLGNRLRNMRPKDSEP
jgi:hypothetical protein